MARELHAAELELRQWAVKAAQAGDNIMAAGHTRAAQHVHARWEDAAAKLDEESKGN